MEKHIELLKQLEYEAAPFRADPGLIPVRRGGSFTIPAACDLPEEKQTAAQDYWIRRWQNVERLVETIARDRFVHTSSPLTRVFVQIDGATYPMGSRICRPHARFFKKKEKLAKMVDVEPAHTLDPPPDGVTVDKVIFLRHPQTTLQTEQKLYEYVLGGRPWSKNVIYE